MTKNNSITLNTVQTISKDYCLPILNELGFKRKSPHYYRANGDLFHCIHFQASQWGSHDKGSFTVNLIVTAEKLYKYWTGASLPKNPATATWPIQVRLGDVCPEARDKWWEIKPHTDISQVGNEIVNRIKNYGLHFFGKYNSIGDIRAAFTSPKKYAGLFQSHAPIIEAIILVEEGSMSKAEEILKKELKINQGKPFSETILKVASRLNLPMN